MKTMVREKEVGKYDIVIVGGGVSGLYTAWRLAAGTDYRVAILEYSGRFGGRYHTCMMPGGFPAELGAMRFIRQLHPIVTNLVEELGLKTERFFDTTAEITAEYYVRGKHIRDDSVAVAGLYGLRESDRLRAEMSGSYNALEIPANGNIFNAKLKGTEQLARNLTLRQWWSESLNPGLISLQSAQVAGWISLISDAGIKQPFTQPGTMSNLMRIEGGGMERLIVRLVEELEKLGVTLLKGHNVTRIEEEQDRFRIKALNSGPVWFSCDKVILACNARGVETITWISKADRTTEMQKLISQVVRSQVSKVYLTYERPWWEEKGIMCGYLRTDLPITHVTILGERAKRNGYSTLLVYNYLNAEDVQGLNSEDEVRFKNSAGEVPQEQTPSRAVVESVQKQLAAAFGFPAIPDPVAACISTWYKDPIAYATYTTKPGVDHNSLYWRSLRPFEDSRIYMIGDTFVPADTTCLYAIWTEGALLTAERVLHQYFGLSPRVDGLCLTNPWPEDD